MLRPLGIFAIAAVLVAAPDGRAVNGVAKTSCVVHVLSVDQRHRGARAVIAYEKLRSREYARDLMGFRPGPVLGDPSRAELRKIRASKRFRHTFRLNPSTLLIRRLLRADGERGVEQDGGGTGVPLAAEEVRDLAFRSRVEHDATRLARFQRLCLGRSSAGVYLFDRRRGVRVAALFTRDTSAHRRQAVRRLRFGSLLAVRRVRYTLRHLEAVQERVANDERALRARNVKLGATDVDIVHNRVEVEVVCGCRDARRILRRKYGDAALVRCTDAASRATRSTSSRDLARLKHLAGFEDRI